MRYIVGALLCAMNAQPLGAANLGEGLKQPVQLRFDSSKALFEVERCLVLSDWGDAPNVYRTPDRPDESLIYFATLGIGRPMTIALAVEGGKLIIRVRNNRKMFRGEIEACV